MSDERIFVLPGGNRKNDFQPTINYKGDLPSQLRSQERAASQPGPSTPVQHQSPAPSQPAYASNPATPPPIQDQRFEDEYESSDDDLPMMHDSTSEEEIENDHEVDFEEHHGGSQYDQSSQPLFGPGSHASEQPTRKSSRLYFE